MNAEFIAAFEEMMRLAAAMYGANPDEITITICRPKQQEIDEQKED